MGETPLMQKLPNPGAFALILRHNKRARCMIEKITLVNILIFVINLVLLYAIHHLCHRVCVTLKAAFFCLQTDSLEEKANCEPFI